jgi:chromosome partitioning protein
LLSFCKKNSYDTGKIYPFFSMVDRRKNLHRQTIDTLSRANKGVLRGFIPYLAQIEKMGIYRAPVTAFFPESAAAKSYQNLWCKVCDGILYPGV